MRTSSPPRSLRSPLLTSAVLLLLALGTTRSADAQSLPNGGSVRGTIAVAGAQHTYTFFANAGEGFQLRLADISQSTFYPQIVLYRPGGVYEGYANGSSVAALGGTAPLTGTYSVVVEDGSTNHDRTGTYDLYFTRAPGANEGGALISGGSHAGRVELGDLDSYTFPMQAGQSFLLRLADLAQGALYPQLLLYAPNGAYLAYHNASTVAVLSGTAAFTGTYTVVVLDGNTTHYGTGDYMLHFVRAPGANEGGALPNGTTVHDTIELGDLDSYTFSIQAGESFLLRVADLAQGALYPQLNLYAPDGSYLDYDNSGTVAALSGTAAFSGIYTVVVLDGNSLHHGTGAYTLEFVRAPGANEGGALPSGGVLRGRIDLGDLDSYTFTASAGEGFQVRVADLALGGFYPQLSLYAPNGSFLSYDSSGAVAALSGTAAWTGTYTVVVSDGNSLRAGSGDYDLHFVRTPGASEHGFLLDGVLVNQDISLGDLDSYSFLARAGQTASFTLTDLAVGSLYPLLALYEPDGSYRTYRSSGTTVTLAVTILRDGIHTVVVTDGNSLRQGTGPYSLLLQGSGEDPRGVRNLIGAAELPSDPLLLDIGGDPDFGPKIGSAQEPFNLALDCRGANAPSIAAFQLWTSFSITPLPTEWGHFYARGSLLLAQVVAHSRTVVPWLPAPGYVLPNDPGLVGVRFTVQGVCGGFGTSVRLSNAVTQTIGS